MPSEFNYEMPIGYLYLINKYGIKTFKNWHTSYLGKSANKSHSEIIKSGPAQNVNELPIQLINEFFPRRLKPDDTVFAHLDFAVKHDGYNLGILTEIFKKLDPNRFAAFIEEKKTSRIRRRLWFLYEWALETRLPIDDLTGRSFIPVLDPEEYYTLPIGERVTRQKVYNNLLGTPQFCPTIRKTEMLKKAESCNYQDKIQTLLSAYDNNIQYRAANYLYLKETKSSFQIEREKINSSRMERFVNLLKSADEKDFCNKESLIELQNQIVDKRFAVKDYRTNQNYVGSTLLSGEEKIHYIPPRPENLSFLMDGLIESHKRMAQGGVSAIAHAAAIAWGFVFLHPFEDGNGRSHRFLIHNILALAGFTPPGFIFPISAVMLKNMDLYDQSLECFSVPLVQLTDYDLDDEGVLMVNNDTGRFYRYIDFTTQTETLLQFIDKTVETELVIELDYLKRYDKTKLALQEIVDLPGQKLELLIRSLSGNKGILGDIRRRKNFDFLTDDEVEQLESSFRENWGESFDAPDDSLNR